jgi:BolA protein
MHRLAAIESRLQAAFAPESLEVADDSQQHVGHAGAGGGGHYTVTIVSARFAGLNTLARHRLVYDALTELMRADVHALSIRALAPDEI